MVQQGRAEEAPVPFGRVPAFKEFGSFRDGTGHDRFHIRHGLRADQWTEVGTL